ncbi:MAG: hypothetical protein LBV41_09550 [Cytophagaceae bacterium]|jgi:hypothetical protein|nr:hypothetical protein [Cytophagaceae bacterium]
MKQAILILTILAIIASGCGQTAQKQTETVTVAGEEADSSRQHESSAISEDDELSVNRFPLVTEADWEGVRCTQYRSEDGYRRTQECVFPDANLQQVYRVIQKIYPHLNAHLPDNDLTYSPPNVKASISYHYKSPKHLCIDLNYASCTIFCEIIEKENETKSRITTYF